ncbi:MAG: hypothetical protein ACLSAO_03880 [Anaerovoracaceae bacterium]
MKVLENMDKEKLDKKEIWESMPEYEALGMTEEDIDMSILDSEE